ncbi:GNAT family N-acetyltransferase [Corynebacterium heidelbergense]|uniref:GNAT family N-acetyltransferase n=1 Tax=Corynebacterium heidelbergense TaxID=2055947 RepID=UPI001EE71D04|nr:GNAT family N-acetyltransferase [Corynebacterium heidelbergense]
MDNRGTMDRMFRQPTVPPAALRVDVVRLNPDQFLRHLDRLVDIHLAAMRYPRSAHQGRRVLWRSNAQEPQFACHVALAHPHGETANPDADGHHPVGVCFSFLGTAATFWYKSVSAGLRNIGWSTDAIREFMGNYTELSEVHLLPEWQNQGVGTHLLAQHLLTVSTPAVMLSTPEARDEGNRAWSLYRKIGFRDVLRDFHFGGDPRPFGILRRERQDIPEVRS